MTLNRPRLALFGAMMALTAMLALSVLSGWHSAAVHEHAPGHASFAEHSHEESGQQDADGPIHILAHANGEWLTATQSLLPAAVAMTRPAWATVAPIIQGGHDPSALLRPPKG